MEQLEKYFDTAFEAPDGIKKLRELILTLAFQGKLLSGNSKLQPASELIASIKSARKIPKNSKKKKVLSNSTGIDKIVTPYDLPIGWDWVQLRDISHDLGQKRPTSQFTYIDVGSIDNKNGKISRLVQTLDSKEAPSRARKIVKEGTIIYSTVRPYLLNIAIVEKLYKPEPIASTAFAILHTYHGINNRYVYYYLRSPVFISYVESLMKGVAYPAINDGNFFDGLIPLPPTIEQNEIVGKIDQFLSRCDELEKLRSNRDQKRLAVHTAAIRKMLDAPDQVTFDDAWQFITRHFGDLYTVRENVAELRKAILQLAVMGKLVKQDPKEGTARELMEEIEREKRKMTKDKTFKPSKELTRIDKESLPFKIPTNWEWVKFGDITFQITDGTHYTPKYVKSGVPFLSVKDMSSGKLDFTATRFISREEHEVLTKRCHPRKGDLLLTKVGTTGIPILIETDKEFSVFVSVAVIKFPTSRISGKYLTCLINSPLVKKQSADGTEGIGNKNLVLRKIQNFLLPLPPLSEQERIVKIIDMIMDLCNSLEQQIAVMERKQGEVLGAVMADVA